MATGERFRSGGARGIARFLAEHQNHDAGFDVQRDQSEGTGRLRITCKGCGETIDYRAADAGELAAGPDALDNGGATASAEAAAGPIGAPPRRSPPGRERPARSRLPRWLATAAIAVLIGGGLLLIAIGLIRDRGGEQSSTPSTSTPTQQAQPQQAQPANTQTAPAAPPAQQGGAGAAGGQAAPKPSLQRRTFANRFSIGVAPGWRSGEQDGAITLTAPGGVAEIDVYFQAGDSSPSAMAGAASGFLERRHPDGHVGAPHSTRLADSPAVRISTTFPGGTEQAVILSQGGYTYLLLIRQDRGANAAIKREAEAELASFRPS
jgi:hypothetical protein